MTSRSIVVGTAALLLLSAAAPVQLGLSPTAAYAQEVSAEVSAALSGDPAQLEPKQLNEHIKVLRDAIQAGVFEGRERKAAQEKVKAYRQALKAHREARKEARQERQTERRAEEKAERRAERQAEREPDAERQAERQAEQPQGEPERQAEQPERERERQAQTQQPQTESKTELDPEVRAALRDDRPASELERAELRARIQNLRTAIRSGALSQEEERRARAKMRADREVAQAQREDQPEESAQEQTREDEPRRRERERADEPSEAEVEQQAREIITDDRPAEDLDEKALRERLSDNREILQTGKLSRDEQRQLRQQLREDREELRSRVASRKEQQEEEEETAEEESGPTSVSEINTKDVSAILEERIPSDQLTERELEERVRVLRRALKAGNISVREAEVARLLIERDRSELRDRLHAKRERRRERWRHARSRNETIIEFNVGYRPPPVIFAAEAMPRDIEVQLVAPPTRQISRPYTVREIATNPDVREMMPGIEIDTLNFDFGSAEVRPEEIDKLDQIGEVIERIVAERPDEVFLIEGHTDAVGTDAANQVLSEQRAQAVAQALLDYFAIDPENLQTVGLGENYLRVWTEEPEEENRRVTVRRITPLLAGGQG